MENRTLPTACFEFTAKEVNELRSVVEHGIDSLYHALAFYSEENPDFCEEIDCRINLLESIHDALEKAYFSTKEVKV